MHLVANAVAGAREVNAVLFGNRLNVAVVVGIFKARLQCVVVYISHAALGFNAVKPHGFKLKVCHCARSVLR